MKTLRLQADDPYIYLLCDSRFPESGSLHEMPDELADEFAAACKAFFNVEERLTAYLKAVHRDEHAHDHDIEINKARLERGRMRHYRRPRPATV